MNRTALCLQMLQLLKTHQLISRVELANELQTNIRNISEFKKELETAGYFIESVSGKFGGYRLVGKSLLKVPSFNEKEKVSIQEACRYISSHHDFLYQKDFQQAMNKLNTGMQDDMKESSVYLENGSQISPKLKEWIDVCEQGKQQEYCVSLTYRSINAPQPSQITIHPYEILYYKGSYYCVAYSLKAKDFRIFKFSEERMKDAVLQTQKFTRDRDFDIKKHIGKSGLVKDEVFEIELLIYHEQAVLASEKQIGLNPMMKWINPHTLQVNTIIEGKMDAISYILSLGNQAKLIKPDVLKQELKKIICDMGKYYES